MDLFGGPAFEVELRRSGLTLTVPSHRTLLSTSRDVLSFVPSSCGFGECGTCRTAVLDGVPDQYADRVLSAEERARNDVMMICVGRSLSPLLVLDL